MKASTLKTRLVEVLTADQLKQVAFTAEGIGIAPNTLRKLLSDDWDQVGRDVIEKVCDRFDIQPGDLLRLTPSPFWQPILEARECTILRGATKAVPLAEGHAEDSGSPLALRLQRRFPDVKFQPQPDLTKPPEIIDYVRSHNCIVLGSPRTNPICEVVFSKQFGARPFESQSDNRDKLPFRFVYGNEDELLNTSALAEPMRKRREKPSKRSGVGIWDTGAQRFMIETDWWPRSEYLARTVHRGLDAGLVLIINRPFGSTQNVKTIVLAGFGAIGTEAAMKLLLSDFRDLEPTKDARFVLGVLEATFKKPGQHEDQRVLTGNPRWRYLRGGRRRVPPNKKGVA